MCSSNVCGIRSTFISENVTAAPDCQLVVGGTSYHQTSNHRTSDPGDDGLTEVNTLLVRQLGCRGGEVDPDTEVSR